MFVLSSWPGLHGLRAALDPVCDPARCLEEVLGDLILDPMVLIHRFKSKALLPHTLFVSCLVHFCEKKKVEV